MAANRDTPGGRLQKRVNRAVNHNDAEAVLSARALQEADIVRKTALVPTDTGVTIKDRSAVMSLALFHLARYNALLPRQAPEELMRSAVLFRFLYRIDPELVPDHLHELASEDFDEKLALQQQAAAAKYITQFENAGNPDLIKAALRALRFALNEFREPSPERVVTLSTLCDALRGKYVITKSADDLDVAVKVGSDARDISDLAPPPIRAAVLCSLGTALYIRGEQNGDADDINSSIHLLNQALDALRAEQSDLAEHVEVAGQDQGNKFRVEFNDNLRPLLSSLSSAYEARYSLNGDRSDLDRAADYAWRAADASQEGDQHSQD